MLNHWLADTSDGQTGSLILETHHKRNQAPHSLDDKSRVPLTFLEAMDDSLLFNSTWPGLRQNALLADRFQITYGWETSWAKSALYVFQSQSLPSEQQTVSVPSVDKNDPTLTATTENEVAIVRDHITFLRVPVDQPEKQFLHMKDIINNFSFPHTHRPLPLTALIRIASQCLISKLRASLTLQPISPNDAQLLDRLIA
ncbi:hypothetical protein H0H92_000536, partial [Tricholoma furcatifolium]